ncbi:hypothetical protein FA15DRAFT_674970 [Coprinopsis marcescibilis]|uniref:Uncharacterized protein n=1 Tax=Coprinopsis marcescibilis TaxID=230819 RepID=A0A5C3KFM4_COPMA|nr:hypothetical protein FA15DRAFT_674970 [Coprinopsis marcescibilis]
MKLSSILAAVFLSVFTLCMPVLSQSPGHHGRKFLDTLDYDFTFAAVNTSLPNANTTGAPLVLGYSGYTHGMAIYVTSTYYTYPYNSYPSLRLVKHALRAIDSRGEWSTNATIVRSRDSLVWISSTMYPYPEDNARIFSAEGCQSSQYPILTAYNISSLWSLCPYPGFRGQTQLVFNATTAGPPPLYDPALCYPVNINIVPAERATVTVPL